MLTESVHQNLGGTSSRYPAVLSEKSYTRSDRQYYLSYNSIKPLRIEALLSQPLVLLCLSSPAVGRVSNWRVQMPTTNGSPSILNNPKTRVWTDF